LREHVRLVLCVRNEGYPASLETQKVYEVLDDEQGLERHQLRVIDESGEDYLYPEDYFVPVSLKQPTKASDVPIQATLNEQLRLLAEYARNLKFGEQHFSQDTQESLVLISRQNFTIVLVGDDAERYNGLKAAIYKALAERRAGVRLSERSVDDLLNDFFVSSLKDGDYSQNLRLAEQVSAAMRVLKTALFEKPKEWEIRLAVEGVDPTGLPLKVGRVEFLHMDEAGIATAKDRLISLIRGMAVPDGAAAADHAARNLEVWRGKTVADLTVDAVDEEAAIRAAKSQLRTTIDAINFFAAREGMGGWLFFPGDAMPQAELVLAICGGERVVPSFRRVGPRLRIPLRRVAGRKGFARLSEILEKEAPNGLEQKILASLSWAGRAQVETRPEEAFLLYAIALESLVLGKDTKNEISHRLVVRCAHLGGGDTLADKERVVNQLRSLYDLRSKIVHTGNFIVGADELALMREYCVLTIFLVLDTEPFRSMQSEKELEDWFSTQLLAGGTMRT
jgi:Apea-like HEPN